MGITMITKLTLRQLQEQLPALLDRAVETGDEYVVQRNGEDYVVILSARGGALRGVTVELRRERHVVARARAAQVGESARRVVLRAAHGKRIRRGHYTLVLRSGSRVIARRAVRVG